jgi:hypothetical protein
VIAVVIVVWRVILAAVLAGVLALLTSVSFWPAYLVCFGVLLVWGVFRWTRAVRGYREYQRRLLDSHRPDGEQDWPGAGGVREPLPSGGPRSPLRAAADPEQSTGPSAIPLPTHDMQPCNERHAFPTVLPPHATSRTTGPARTSRPLTGHRAAMRTGITDRRRPVTIPCRTARAARVGL